MKFARQRFEETDQKLREVTLSHVETIKINHKFMAMDREIKEMAQKVTNELNAVTRREMKQKQIIINLFR